MKMHDNDDDDEGSDDEAVKKKNLKEKLVFYIEQLEISNNFLHINPTTGQRQR